MGACGLEFRVRIFGTAGRRPSAALYGGASFRYNRLASDMCRRIACATLAASPYPAPDRNQRNCPEGTP
ncbi:hypothetical protein D9M72_111090 [compost metagenome]|jgi:hypothetical protein